MSQASQGRRKFSAEFKTATILEAIKGEKSIAQICRERNIKDTLYYKWRDQFEQGVAVIFGATPLNQQMQQQALRIAELERLVGQLTLENSVLKKVQPLRPSHTPKSDA